MATVPVKAQTTAATVQRPGPGQTGLTVTSLPATASPVSKPATSSPGTSAPSASTAAVIQNVTGQNIIKQVGGALSGGSQSFILEQGPLELEVLGQTACTWEEDLSALTLSL